MHPHNVPCFPWQKFPTDLFNYQGGQYLLIPDFYSKYPIIESLPQSHTDNRPQSTHCSSQESAAFCKQSRIDHVTSSPLYRQSNGFTDNSPDSNESSRISGSLRERPLSSTVDIPFQTYRQQPTIACPTAEPQRLPHTVTKQWMASTFSRPC